MCNLTLYPLIKTYQAGDMSVFELIHNEFKNMNMYYSIRLRYDDALQELNVFLVELLYNIPLYKFSQDSSISLNSYIAVAIKNKYIALSRAKQEERFVELDENLLYDSPRYEENIILEAALSNLSEKQRTVIYEKYIYGYSDCEISESLRISRQAVNRLINRGIALLREYYMEN